MAAMASEHGSANGAVLAAPRPAIYPVMDPAEIDRLWVQFVGDGVQNVIDRSRGLCDFLKEEVYVFLRRKAAFLYMVDVDGETGGFAILRKMKRPWSGDEYLEIWVGYSMEQKFADAFWKDFPRVMTELKYTQAAFETARSGFERVTPPGWRVITRTLAIDLEKSDG